MLQWTQEHDLKTGSEIICDKIMSYFKILTANELPNLQKAPIYHQIRDRIQKGKSLHFILPAFPAKSPNPEKTSGPSADLGEVLGLQNLNSLCIKIKQIYSPGAFVTICSDGRVFNDLVLVNEKDLSTYSKQLMSIRDEFNLTHINFYALEDEFFRNKQNFLEMYGPSIADIKLEVKNKKSTQNLFNGLHRFLLEDRRVLFPQKSKNSLSMECKKLTYELIQRSRAWDNWLKTQFPHTLRLSIHPYPIESTKFGINLVPSSDRWATPWHNVTVKIKDQFRLMKRKEALRIGAQLKYVKGTYAYFEV